MNQEKIKLQKEAEKGPIFKKAPGPSQPNLISNPVLLQLHTTQGLVLNSELSRLFYLPDPVYVRSISSS